jgi:hypothetical protein
MMNDYRTQDARSDAIGIEIRGTTEIERLVSVRYDDYAFGEHCGASQNRPAALKNV